MCAAKVANKKSNRIKKAKKNNTDFSSIINPSIGSDNSKGDYEEVQNNENMSNLNLNDDLGFGGISVDDNCEVIFPYDVNKRLSEQVQALLRENTVLQRSLVESEARLRGVQKYPPAMAMHGRASDLAASKIVELTKRVRELTADLEVAKLKCRNAVMSSITCTQNPSKEHSNENLNEKKVEDKTNELKDVSDKLAITNLKLCECRNQCQQLKHELKIAHKALVNEVGDNVSVHNSISGGNWRGRAQQICALQQQVAELTDKLNQTSVHDKQINVNKSATRQIEKELRAENVKEILVYKEQLEEKHRKLDASKARNKVLESQLAELRGRVVTLLEKTAHDDQLITALTAQLGSVSEKKEQDFSMKKELQCKSLERELSQEKQRVSHLQSAILERDDRISLLDEKVKELQNLLDKENCDKPSAKCTPAEVTPFNVALDTLGVAAEAERVRLLELLSVTSKRLSQERNTANKTQEMLRKERQKAARLETKLARQELERVSTKCSSYHSASSMKVIEPLPQEAKYKLELLEEEVLYLKTRLNSVELEKDEDLRNYTTLLDEARRTFLDTIRNIKSE